VALAEGSDIEIVSVDSMLVYRGMDVGTAKPTVEQRARVAHHLIDLAEPSEPFGVARYQSLGFETLEQIAARGGRALLCGGSGLYFRALVDDLKFPGTDASTREQLEIEASVVGAERLHGRLVGLDPVAASKIEPANVRRTVRALEVAAITGREFSSFGWAWKRYPPERVRAAGIELEPRDLVARIRTRVRTMIESGFCEEVRDLISLGSSDWLTSTQAIGYAELAQHLEGHLGLEDAIEQTIRRTRNLARRQMAWFRRDPRIRWFQAGPEGAIGVLDDLRAYLEDR
jgi:tRNA dimethylallyltransferase